MYVHDGHFSIDHKNRIVRHLLEHVARSSRRGIRSYRHWPRGSLAAEQLRKCARELSLPSRLRCDTICARERGVARLILGRSRRHGSCQRCASRRVHGQRSWRRRHVLYTAWLEHWTASRCSPGTDIRVGSHCRGLSDQELRRPLLLHRHRLLYHCRLAR